MTSGSRYMTENNCQAPYKILYSTLQNFVVYSSTMQKWEHTSDCLLLATATQ